MTSAGVTYPAPPPAPLKAQAQPQQIPPDVREALDRGRKVMLKDAAKRRLCMRFERGDAYWFINSKGGLSAQSTVTAPDMSGKPLHRVRNSYNQIRPLIEDKVSAATSRIPSYEVVPSTSDPEDRSAAGISQKVALYGYDRWRLRAKRMKVIKSAIAHGGDGFALPTFDADVGPYTEVDGEYVGQGELKIITLGGNECYWEAGMDFNDSPWYATERARPVDEVARTPGFYGPKLVADASDSDIPNDRDGSDNLVMVTDYMERPCSLWPEGRRIIIANNRIIVDYRLVDPQRSQVNPWESYPLRDHNGDVLDEPVIHRLSYTVDPDSDRDLGLVWQLIDSQRTINDCLNKLIEWKNRCLNPQLLAAVNSLINRPNDEPGFVNYYRMGMPEPKWQPSPQIPQELFRIYEVMQEAMRFIASYADATAAPNVAAASQQAEIEQSQARWNSFLGDLAEFDSRLMRHCLMLVANFYTEPRLLKINGWFGPDLVTDFTGAQLNGQVDVTVLPGSLTQLSKAEMLNRLQWIAQTFPGWLSPEMALAALDGGAAQTLVRSYELDDAKVCRIIQKIRDGSVMTMPTRHETDPITGAPLMDPVTGQPAEVPSYMPLQDVDNLTVWRRRIGDWMKTPDFERTHPGMQEVAKQILAAINMLELRAQQQQMAAQAAQAEQMGMGNAAKPQGFKPVPDTPTPGSAPQ